jgi:hypothetical protein
MMCKRCAVPPNELSPFPGLLHATKDVVVRARYSSLVFGPAGNTLLDAIDRLWVPSVPAFLVPRDLRAGGKIRRPGTSWKASFRDPDL